MTISRRESSAATAGDAPAQTDDGAFEMKGVGRHAAVYGLGILMSKVVAFVMLPIYTRYLTTDDYGVMALIEMTLDVIAIVAGAQLALGIFRFYHKATSELERDAVVSTAVLGLAVSYAVVGGIALVSAPFLSDLVFGNTEQTFLIRLAAGSLGFSSLTIVPLAYARVQDRSTLFVMANLARLVLSLGLNLLTLVYLGMGIEGVFVSSFISSFVVGVTLSVWVFHNVGLHFSRKATKDLLRYGVPLMATQLATFIATFSDRYFLNAAADEGAVGIYSMAYQFGFLLAAVGYAPFETVWAPKRFEIAKRPDRDEVLSRGFEYENILLLTCGLGIALFVGDVLRIMATPPFFSAADIVPVILVAYIFQAWAGAHDIGILISEKTGFVTLANWTAAAVALLGYWLLVPRYFGLGAALATVASFGTRWLLTYLFSQGLWRVQYAWSPVLRLLTLAVVGSLVGIALPDLPILISLGARTAIVALYGVLAWRLAISAPVKAEIRSIATAFIANARRRLRDRRAIA